MAGLARAIRLQGRSGANLVLALGLAIFTLFLAGIVGAFGVTDDGDDTEVASEGVDAGLPGLNEGGSSEGDGAGLEGLGGDATDSTSPGTVDGTISTGGAAPGATSRPGQPGSSAPGSTPGTAGAAAPAATGAGDRTGVSKTEVKWALHAPVTFDGAPLNLAEDPLEGVANYINFLNQSGGIHGRKIAYQVFDDRYTVDGGKQAANAAINDYKPFFVSGTLGVDQIAQVAAEARNRRVPYMAAGGSESLFKDIGMFQIAASYDTHLIKLAEFLAKESSKTPDQSPFSGLKKVGVTALDSPYITPSVDSFRRALEGNGMEFTKLTKNIKPTEQTSYAANIQQHKDAGTQILVPAQDPITTGRMAQECVQQRCPWKWSASNFAHESDTALQLMGGTWNGIRILAGGCYYLSETAYDPSKCGSMNKAHDQWVRVSSEDEWRKDGQGGASGFQIVNIWNKALRDAGPDPTRERFTAALLSYENYADLVSGPITYRGSPNLAHGAELMVVYQAGVDRWTQVTPGFVSSF